MRLSDARHAGSEQMTDHEHTAPPSDPELRIKAHLVMQSDPDVGMIVDAPDPLVDDQGQPHILALVARCRRQWARAGRLAV